MLNANDFLSTKVFAEIAKEQSKDPYADSPFKSLKDLSSKKKGKYFEHIYQEYMQSKVLFCGVMALTFVGNKSALIKTMMM